MAKLSIIICVYNTDEHLFEECLSSVFNSTVKDFEVIVVDDGSNKDYSKLLKKYDKINYLKTENQGTLKARLFGIKKAVGDYICFVDSDDTISFCYFEAMLKKAEENDLDICLNDWAFKTQKCTYVCQNDSTIGSEVVAKDGEVLTKFFAQQGKEHSYYVLWNKIFKREILLYATREIDKLNLDKLVFAEDVLICYFAYKVAKTIQNIHFGYYFYRVHGGQQIDISGENKLRNHIESMALVFDIIESDLKIISLFDDFKNDFCAWKNLLCTTNYLTAKRSGFADLTSYIKEKYDIEIIEKLPKKYDHAYIKQKILPSNIEQIDTQLKKVYHSNRYLKIFAGKNKYAKVMLEKMKQYFAKRLSFEKYKNLADIQICKEQISLKQQILHNIFVQKMGMLLFPKGSKIRKLLKSKL